MKRDKGIITQINLREEEFRQYAEYKDTQVMLYQTILIKMIKNNYLIHLNKG